MSTTMLYRAGNSDNFWGVDCEAKIFNDCMVDAAISDGWVMHPFELDKKSDQDQDGDGKITQEEARAYLTEKGIDHSKMHWKTAVAEAAKLKAQEVE